MTSITNYFLTTLSIVGNSFFSPSEDENLMKEMPYFLAPEWKIYLNQDVAPINISEKLRLKLESPCPFWEGKLVKETHLVCQNVRDLTIEKLFENAGYNSNGLSLISHAIRSPTDTYLFLITKKPIPNTRYVEIEEQKKMLEPYGYNVPTVLEAGLSVLAANSLVGISIFPSPGHFTRTQEELNGWPIAIGTDANDPFCISTNDWCKSNGIAGVFYP